MYNNITVRFRRTNDEHRNWRIDVLSWRLVTCVDRDRVRSDCVQLCSDSESFGGTGYVWQVKRTVIELWVCVWKQKLVECYCYCCLVKMFVYNSFSRVLGRLVCQR